MLYIVSVMYTYKVSVMYTVVSVMYTVQCQSCIPYIVSVMYTV